MQTDNSTIDRAVQKRFEKTINTLQAQPNVNLSEKEINEVAKDLAYDHTRSLQTVRDINAAPWKEQLKFHTKTAVATVVVGVGAALIAGAVASRIAKKSSAQASGENAAGTEENPFADAGVAASDRPASTLRRASSH